LASSLQYKQTLQVHNFIIYSFDDGNVTLYILHEADGCVTADDFKDFFTYLSGTYKHATIISDGYNYQNRNIILSVTIDVIIVIYTRGTDMQIEYLNAVKK
jgi:hypothetical protein